ncbi:MAG: sulfotransferase [Proteobacteria bacterium]|nr:sulfotransferase [Pseudomonadota bacterium]
MTLPNHPPTKPRHETEAAVQRDDIERADDRYLEQSRSARNDPRWLADYASFCLRTGRAERASWLFFRAYRLGDTSADLLSRFGYAQFESQAPQAAMGLFADAIAADPSHAQAQYGLAACLRIEGAWPEAAAAFQRALALQPDTLPILLDLADAHHNAGNDLQARACLRRARGIAPNDAGALLETGRLLRAMGDCDEAMRCLERCRTLLPHDNMVLLESARCLRAKGQPRSAIPLLTPSSALLQRHAEYHEELGNCLQLPSERDARTRHWGIAADLWIQQGELDQAEALLERMAATSAGHAVTWVLTGLLHVARKQFDQALDAFRKAIDVDSNGIDGYANLAIFSEQVNRIAEAEAAVDRGLRLAETRNDVPGNALRSLLITAAKVARRNKQAERALAFCSRMDRIDATVKDRRIVASERAKTYDLQGRTDEAIAQVEHGNALARKDWDTAHPGANTFLRGVEYMRSLFQQGWHERWHRIDDIAERGSWKPAFLIGFPRSGTTLLNQILYCHSAIRTSEEQPQVLRMRTAVQNMPEGYPHALADFDRHDVAWLRQLYWREAGGMSGGNGGILIDKFPMHTTLAPLIHRVFPGSKFIFALRHPCDVVLSCFMQDFETNEAMANFFTLADAVTTYARVMELWVIYRNALPLVVHEIRYEDVVDDFQKSIGSLCDFLEIPWEDGLARFNERSLGRGRIFTPSYEQVHRPIYREARYRWERYRKHLDPFLPTLRPWIVRWGYDDPLA